ncbi:EAL and HDOD domain-containing protein [Clostridium chromiireducens]|uniref:Biofilm formation regulator HmsP n=1 Tax=Clostridium chromiireducens TaxID=225345 RepID=A0A1V4ITI2_9CLOT|nr:EAL domain-containing protein [Clostridium chromiireducens]OPJ63341.1 biofilm formation regulator HmsP [Clostridium chromiireducens]RII33797.1 EAL domain-containing protein [Clostridium chromiireducens]
MDVYVARQAIFDINKEVIAYEVLFRNNNIDNEFISIKNVNPTLDVIRNSFFVIGINKITGGKKAFVNFDEELIKSEIIERFSKDHLAVEVLESVKPDYVIIDCCRRLKEKGYIIALDDFSYNEQFDKLMKYIDIIKVDFLVTKGKERKEIISKIKNTNINIKFLAEKVETEEEYREALSYGYSYFQGYFFCRPVIISGRDVSGYKFTYMNLINELNKETVNIEVVEALVKSDVFLSYKLLKEANSAYHYIKRKIVSIRDAIMIIGINELKRWIFIITLKQIGENNIDELVRMSLIRASFMEVVSKKFHLDIPAFDAFLTGIFSLIHVLLKMPIEKILIDLPISSDVKDALLGKNNIILELLELTIEYEKGNWIEVNKLIKKFELNEEFVGNCYLNSIINLKILEEI